MTNTDMISTSHTSVTAFSTCKRKWYFKYVKGLAPRYKSKPLRMGTVFSDCLEKQDHEVANEYYNELISDSLISENHQFVVDLVEECVIVRELAKTYIKDMPPQLREVEFEFFVEGTRCKGFIDGLIVHDDESVTIIENKLLGRWDYASEMSMATDAQLTQYVDAVLRMGGKHGIPEGITPDRIGVCKDVTLKPQIRKRKTDTEDSFRERLIADIEQRTEHYHRSFHTTRTHDQVMEHRVIQRKNALNMRDEKDFFPNYHACSLYGLCEFHKICSARTDDEQERALAMMTIRE